MIEEPFLQKEIDCRVTKEHGGQDGYYSEEQAQSRIGTKREEVVAKE